MNLPNIDFKKKKSNPTIDSITAEYELPFYKDVDYFISLDNFVSFVKGCERLIRSSEEYKAFKAHLMEDYGMDHCQVLGNIQADEGNAVKIEMHHGPLTLFDVVAIVTDHRLSEGLRVNTFIIAKIVVDEHINNNVQVTMLSETIHQSVHDNDIFLNYKHFFGDLNGFIKKYPKGLQHNHIRDINNYIEKSLKSDTFDTGVLKLAETVTSWNRDYGDYEDLGGMYDDVIDY